MKVPGIEKVPELNSTNYRAWCDNMKNALQLSKLWRLVNGMETHPLVTPLPTDTNKVTESLRVTFAEETNLHMIGMRRLNRQQL